jgi:hypothetical protein
VAAGRCHNSAQDGPAAADMVAAELPRAQLHVDLGDARSSRDQSIRPVQVGYRRCHCVLPPGAYSRRIQCRRPDMLVSP